MSTTAATVSLLRWLRRQLREPAPQRERLEAAIANDDPAEARRLLAHTPFSEAQRRTDTVAARSVITSNVCSRSGNATFETNHDAVSSSVKTR